MSILKALGFSYEFTTARGGRSRKLTTVSQSVSIENGN